MAVRTPVPAPVPAPVPVPVPAEAAPPRSADFDRLFADPEPLVTAAGPVEDPARPVEDLVARADIDALYRENGARVQDTQNLAARLGNLSGQVTALAANVAEQGRQLDSLTGEISVTQTIPKALAALTASQRALERRLADLSREVGPEGLSSQLAAQLAALKGAVDSAGSQSRDAAQRLEARIESQVQARMRTLSREVQAVQRQASELQSKLSAFRPSAAAVEVPLQDTAARRTAVRQAAIVGIALLVLLLTAIALWVRGARQRADEDADVAADGDDSANDAVDQDMLRDELMQLSAEIDSERLRAGDLDERLKRMTAYLSNSQTREKRLTAELAAVRVDTRTVGRGLLDGAARDAAMGDELKVLRQAIEAERARARDLQTLVDDLKSSVAVAQAPPQRDEKGIPEAANHQEAPPALVDLAMRRRAIEALHNGDLPGFEKAFAQLTALPLTEIERIVRHSSGQDLALACRAVGIAKPHLAAVLILSRRAPPGMGQLAQQRLEPKQLAKAIATFDESSAEAASQALQDWRAAGQ